MRATRLLVCAAALGSVSCAALLGFEHLSEDAPPITEAGVDAGASDADAGGADDGGSRACGEIGIPPAPTNTPPGEVEPVLSALKLLDFGIRRDGGTPDIPGLNLDQTCSDTPSTGSCTVDVLPATFEAYAKDKNASGLDNAGFSLIEYISSLSDVLSAESINAGIARGDYGGVLRITKWNGTDADDDVSVEIFPAIGVQPREEPDAGPGPRFDADDVWLLDEAYRLGGVLDASSIKSDRAYVVGGRLVARFKSITLPIKIDDDPRLLEVRLSDALVVGNLESIGENLRTFASGVITGRWKASDFLGQVRTIYIKDSTGLEDTFLCEPAASAIYNAVKSQVCDGRDIRADSQDNKNLPCDAVSAAAKIAAYRVNTLGAFTPSFDAGVRCVDASTDDCPP